MDDVEIGAPLPALRASDPRTELSYGSSLCVVRLHGKPLGLIQVDLPPEGLSADALAARIQAELADEVAQHLSDDGLPPSALDAGGIPGPEPPRARSRATSSSVRPRPSRWSSARAIAPTR